MKKYMPLEGLRWSRDSGSTLCDTPQNGRSRTGWGGVFLYTKELTPLVAFVGTFVVCYVSSVIIAGCKYTKFLC